MKKKWIISFLLILVLPLSVLYGSAPLILPKPLKASAAAEQFSAERAMRHVNALAQYPRVTGTPGMVTAVEYISGVLEACGLEVETELAPSPKGLLRNVVVRLPGAQPGNALLIVSHLDSISYGAGDNASGAAVLLESACALKAGPPLLNDVILLFEDGEEYGYLGGYAFVEMDPSIGTIRRVIGLDTAAWGPVVLLQTTPANMDLIRAYAQVKRPTAFGFYADADWNISQDSSEIQPYFEQGVPGLELEDPTAFSGKHSDADTIARVKPGSIQQMGDQVLTLARSLGNSDLSLASKSSYSYFSLWGFGLIHYPAKWNLVFTVIAAIGLIGLIMREFKLRTMSVKGIPLAILIILLSMVGAIITGIIADKVFSVLFPNRNPNIGGYLVPASLPSFLIVIGMEVVGYLFLRRIMTRRFGSSTVQIAGLLFWLLLSLTTAILLPVGSYLFTLPLICAVLMNFLPDKWKSLQLFAAAFATILLTPNVVLAFLGTGLETLMLVNLILAMNVELWAGSWGSGR